MSMPNALSVVDVHPKSPKVSQDKRLPLCQVLKEKIDRDVAGDNSNRAYRAVAHKVRTITTKEYREIPLPVVFLMQCSSMNCQT